MEIVEDRVFDAGVDQIAGERLLPNPLGNPDAADGGAQAILQESGIAADLSDAIPRGNHRQDRLEICPAENLDPSLLDELGQPVDVLGLVRGQPFHQRAADVQRHLQRGIAAEDVEEVAVTVVEGALEYFVKVADGLMVVQGEDETYAVGHDRWVAGVLGCSCCKAATSGRGFDSRWNANISLIGNRTPVYPVCLLGIVCGSGISTSTSRRKAAACSGGTGLM